MLRRHFLLLTFFSVWVGLISQRQSAVTLAASFALYGALHAIALALTLGVHRPGMNCLFVATAAALSAMILHLGILGTRLSSVFPGILGLYSVLGLMAAAGALSYGALIRLFGMRALSLRELAAISVGCALSVYLGLLTLSLRHPHYLGSWWLAVLWWYGFSGGLWYVDARRRTAAAA